jgi:hypothetical protein
LVWVSLCSTFPLPFWKNKNILPYFTQHTYNHCLLFCQALQTEMQMERSFPQKAFGLVGKMALCISDN